MRQWGVLYVVCFVVAGLVYGPEVFYPTLGIDDYLYMLSGDGHTQFEITRGIWMFSLVNKLLPGVIIAPVVSTVIFVAINVLSAVMLCIAWSRSSSPGAHAYLLAFIFTLFPYFGCQAAFNYYQIGYSISTLFSILSVLLAVNARFFWQRFACIACFVMSIGFYQGGLGVSATAFVAMALVDAVDLIANNKNIESFFLCVRKYFYALLSMIAASIAYVVVHKFVLLALGIQDSGQQYSIAFDVFFWNRIEEVYALLLGLITGYDNILPFSSLLIFAVLFVALLLMGWINCLAKKMWPGLFLLPVLLVVVLISPGIALFVCKLAVSARSGVAYAIVWMVVSCAILRFGYKHANRVVAALLVIVVLSFSLKLDEMFLSQRITMQMDQTMASLIYNRITLLPDYKSKSVAFIGAHYFIESAGHHRFNPEVLGCSSFEWDNGKIGRAWCRERV